MIYQTKGVGMRKAVPGGGLDQNPPIGSAISQV